MFRNINVNLSLKGIEEASNQEERLDQRERVILSPLPCENNKLQDSADSRNQQVHDYCSDDSVKDPDYVNNNDNYYSDSDLSDFNSQKGTKLQKTKFAENIDPTISIAAKNKCSSQINTPVSHQNIVDYNDPVPGPSKVLHVSVRSSSSSSSSSSNSSDSSSESSDSSDSEHETNVAKTHPIMSCEEMTTDGNILEIANALQTTVSNDRDLHSPIQNNSCPRQMDSPVGDSTGDKETTNKIGRKRKANPNNWMSVKAKILRNHGKTYLTKKNKIVPERKLKPPCGDKCKFKCKENITDLQRKMIFQCYWDMGDLERQREYIMRHISVIKPRYSYKVHNSNRGNNFAFYLSIEDKKIRVCKTFFKATLDINDRVIKTVIQKTSDKAILEQDRRGKHENHAQLDPMIKDSIRTHLDSIPKVDSHYCRADSKRTYIEGGKNIADLHRDYVAECKSKGLPFGNYLAYYSIFCSEYNMAFFQPKKDQCEDCTNYINATEEDKQIMKNNYEIHLKEKQLARDQKDEDKKYTPDNCIVSVYDLQAAMPCPKGETSTFYYLSKLNCYNFTIYDIKTKDVNCYVWHEGEGKRGAVEIGTCVLKYIESLEETAKKLDSKLDLIFYSDNCCGQQKNHYLIAVYIFAVHNFDFINSICHKFLIKGHTQNEGDSVHSVIERQIKRSLKSGAIYTPDQYTQIIRSAKKSGTPYKVHELTHADFYDVKKLATAIGKNFSKNANKGSVKLTDIKILKVAPDPDDIQNYSFYYRTSYQEEHFNKVIVDKIGRTRNTQNKIVLTQAYTSKMEVCEKKKRGLLGLLRKNTIPKCYSLFYENL